MTNHIRVSSSPLPRLYSEAKPVIAPVHSALCDLSSRTPLSLPSLVIAPVHSALLERIGSTPRVCVTSEIVSSISSRRRC